ncbi:hypothetical protein SKAU_G00363380 [Synaphobranchus kaupii]|uniref:Uncharacterized protein n=1 Tax=Synaphobranchus kaupii TaxID=118154 RepID=A0A9Q1EIR7_SYNKA|nr:hypothetical protein SKAU_G00363380 [Synaphobranchus kaupii]
MSPQLFGPPLRLSALFIPDLGRPLTAKRGDLWPARQSGPRAAGERAEPVEPATWMPIKSHPDTGTSSFPPSLASLHSVPPPPTPHPPPPAPEDYGRGATIAGRPSLYVKFFAFYLGSPAQLLAASPRASTSAAKSCDTRAAQALKRRRCTAPVSLLQERRGLLAVDSGPAVVVVRMSCLSWGSGAVVQALCGIEPR